MKDQPMNLDDFFKNTIIDIEKKINTTIPDKEIVLILQGGKRLRSVLAHLSFKACTCGKETPAQFQRALEGAVSIELAHGASLVHDDIIDKDNERRGKPAFHIKKGVANAILTGHKMLASGFNIALSHGKRVAELYVESWNEAVNGELNEVKFNKKSNGNTKEVTMASAIFEAYEKIIDMKTASLFSSACKAGAIEADMTGDILKVFANYGREIGLAYQLADDLVDLVEGEMIEIAIIPLLVKLGYNPTAHKLEVKAIKKKFDENSDKIQELYIKEIKKHVKKAEELSKSNMIPSSPYKILLSVAPAYVINRMLREIKVTI